MPLPANSPERYGFHGLQRFLLQSIFTISKTLAFFWNGSGKYFTGIVHQKGLVALPPAGSHNIFNEVVKIQHHL